MPRRVQNLGNHGLPSRRRLRLLAHVAAAAYRSESAIELRFGAAGLDHLAAFQREGLVEYHSLVTNTVHITAAGRSALKRMREAARARRAAA